VFTHYAYLHGHVSLKNDITWQSQTAFSLARSFLEKGGPRVKATPTSTRLIERYGFRLAWVAKCDGCAADLSRHDGCECSVGRERSDVK
jgi:hypothetical protein